MVSGVHASATSILRDEVDNARGRIGGQLAVFVNGRLTDQTAIGYSGPSMPMTHEMLHNVWCGTKPIFHTAALHLLWRRQLTAVHLRDLLPDDVGRCLPSAVAALTPADLVSHRIGLPDPHVMMAMHVPIVDRNRLLLDSLKSAQAGNTAGTYAPSKLLELALDNVLGHPSGAFVDEWCRNHLTFASEVRFNIAPHELRDASCSIGPYALTRYRHTIYSYHDRSISVACDDRLATGGFASMRALAEFYSLLVDGSRIEPAFVAWLYEQEPNTVRDSSIGAEITCVGGLNAGLPSYRPRTRCFGLPGLTGSSYGFVMPDAGVSAAFMVNEFFQNTADIDFFRTRMVRAIEDQYAP